MFNTIRAKLIVAFAVLITLGILTGTLGLTNAGKIRETSAWNEHTYKVLRDIVAIREAMINIETGQRGFLVFGTDNYLEPYHMGIANVKEQLDKVMELTSDNPVQTARFKALRDEYNKWMNESVNKTIEVRRSLTRQEIDQTEFLKQQDSLSGKPMMDKMRGMFAEIEQMELDLLVERTKARESAYNTAIWSVSISVTLSLLIGFLATMILSKLLSSKLDTANKHIKALANGHLNSKIESNDKDEVDQLLTGLAAAQNNLRKLIEGVRQSAHELGSSATQVTESSRTMANAGVEQANATSSMAAAVEELTVSISQISENSNEATDTANEAKKSAESGMITLGEVVQSIQRISNAVKTSATAVQSLERQSADISEIVSTITEIAERTNLLALNAAIEAARAGEQGRGFAVVADEVRRLAEQTKGSTDRISSMVYEIQNITKGAVTSMDTSVHLVQEGIVQTDAVNGIIQKIKTDSDKVSEAIEAIAISMKEQSNVCVEISQNVERVAQMTEENTTVSQQNNQVAAHLSSVSESMMSSVGVFKTA
jgi:methyl-accepting chemotaxis protein